MRFAATPTHPCSHYSAICIQTLQHTKKEKPIRPRNDRSCTRRTQEVPFNAACSHFTRKNTRFRAPASSPTQVPCNIHAAITMRFAATPTHPCSHYTTICIRSLYSLQSTEEEPIRPRNDRSRTRRRQEVPLIAACSHSTRKNTRFGAPASSPTQVPCNIHAAITMRFAATPTHPCSHYTTICIRSLYSLKHRGGTDSTPKRLQPHPPHTGGTFHRRLQPLYTEKDQVSCSGFLPNTGLVQHSCSHTMRIAATRTHPCSHDNTICIHTLQNTKGEAIRPRNDRRTRRTQEVPFIAACSHFTRTNTRFRALVPPQHKFHATFMQPLQCNLHPDVAEHRGETRFDPETTAAALAAHRRYLSTPPAAALHGKTQGFVLRRPPQHKSHATFMQPLQCGLQQHLHTRAAITLRFASARYTRCRAQRRNRFDPETTAAPAAHRRYLSSLPAATLHRKTQGFVVWLRRQHKSHATFMQPLYNVFCSNTYTSMQPLQCVLHPHVAEHQGRSDSTAKRLQPHPPHTGGTFHRRLQPLYTEKRQVSCSGFLPNTNPMQHSCSHYNAFCSNTYTSVQPLHHDSHPLVIRVAEHRGGTDSNPKRPQPHPPHTGGTFHRRLQPLYTEKHKGSCSGFLPNTSNILMQPLQCVFHHNAFCSNTYTSIKPPTTLHECIVM